MNAISERINERCKRDEDLISDQLDMLIDLLQGYKVSKKTNLFSYILNIKISLGSM